MEQLTNGGTPKASDALSGELWEVKKQRIRNASVHGKLPGWDMRSVSFALCWDFITQLHAFIYSYPWHTMSYLAYHVCKLIQCTNILLI